jgi:putative ABC transport system permease protein
MVGVGFFAGVNATSPNVVRVADNYYKSQVLMDFKLVSSMGLTNADADALEQLEGVKEAVSSYSLDAQSSKGNVIRIHALEEDVNIVNLTEGRLPKINSECVADSSMYMIGDKIEISYKDDIEEKLCNNEFTVVGLVNSVLYLSEEYGSTSIGNGKLHSFIFVNKTNFVLEAYTEIYLVAETNNAAAYSDEYKRFATLLNDELVNLKTSRENARYYEIYNKAIEEIEKNEAELNAERIKAEKEFSNAKKTLDDNAQKLQNAKDEITKNEDALEETINTKNAEFDAAKQFIAYGWQEINTALSEAGITTEDIDIKIDEITIFITNLKLQLETLPINSPEYTALNTTIKIYSEKLDELKQLKNSINNLTIQEEQLNDGIALFNDEIEKAKTELLNAKKEIATNEKELNNGYAEYNSNLTKFNKEITEATTKINNAKKELADLTHPAWYIFDRNTVNGYTELDNIINIIKAIANVLPFFFILISMLMTSNSMARMITEERNELGTLTSIGYKDNKIISTYLIYVLSATGIGTLTGFFIGCRVIPPLIYSNFVFNLPPLTLEYSPITLGLITIITLVLMSLVTLFACNKELKQKPAYLTRPLPPQKGQRIFLEKINVIWKRFSFTWKVTIRNMFRYKKRVFMTIIGIAGCTALLITAFGIHDGMSGVAKKQYGDILQYSETIILKDETPTIDGELKSLLENEEIINPLLLKQNAYNSEQEGKKLDFYLVVPQNEELFYKYFNLKSTIDKQKINLEEGNIIVTQRIAKVFSLTKGDIFTIKDMNNNSYNLTVSDIAENYISNFIYMNTLTYSKIFNETITFNIIVSNSNINKETPLAERLIDNGLIVNIIFTYDTMDTISESTQRLSGVIVLVIIVASLLTIVVLYNLTSINISERTREIATLKVLGFHDKETNAYIYREALILTIISMGVGIIAGAILHHYLINVIENSALSLFNHINWFSYIIACVLIMIFSGIMQTVTYFELRKINMIESLKSVE